MSRSSVQIQQRQRLERSLDQTLIGHGLAALVPCKRRGRAPLALKLVLLLLGLATLLGLPLGGLFVCLVLAVTLEAVSYYWQALVPLPRAFLRPSVWDRIRPPFYWTLAVGAFLVSLLHADESLLTGLLRAGLLWLCFRGIESLVTHPERTSSFDGLLDWLERLEQQVGRVLSSWLSFGSLAIVAGLALALAAPGIWESAGNAGWDRLLVVCGGLYLIAIVTLLRSTKSTVRATTQKSLQLWDEPQVEDLEAVLCPPPSAAARRGLPGCAEQLTDGLAWKDVDRLAARTGTELEITLIQRLRWSAFLSSLLAFLLASAFLATAVFLIVPREVMANWVSPDQADAGAIVLAFGDFEELLSLEFAERVLGLDWSGLDQEPLPKVIFLEAAVLASLMLFRTATDRSALKFLSGAEPANIQRWLLLGTAYLVLLEREFQYLYHGLATRQVTGAATSSTVKMRNVILLAPSVSTKAGAYRAITSFFQTYGPPEWSSSSDLVAVFANSRSAQEWAARFLRSASPAVEGRQGPAQQVFSVPDEGPGKFWIWSEEQLIDLASFEEAQVYGRFVTNYYN
jgi:hypothetical protein